MEKQILKSLLTLFLSANLLFLTNCGSKNAVSSDLPIDTYSPLSDAFTSRTNQSLVGSGEVIFTAVTTGVNSKQSFNLSFKLPSDGSKVILVSNTADSTALSLGIRMEFSRVNGTIKGTIQINDGPTVEIDPLRLMVFNPQKVELVIEVHNESPVRVLFWWQSSAEYTENLADFDSNSDMLGNLGVATGPGSRWGLSLTNAEVTKAQLKNAYIQ